VVTTIRSKPVLWNLLILLLVALPLAILLGWLAFVIFPPDWMKSGGWPKSLTNGLWGFVFWYLILVLPIGLGGLVHQAILGIIPNTWSAGVKRIAILVSAPLVPAGLWMIGHPPDLNLGTGRYLLAAVAISTLTYGLLAKPLAV
jgi:hypothetical protein